MQAESIRLHRPPECPSTQRVAAHTAGAILGGELFVVILILAARSFKKRVERYSELGSQPRTSLVRYEAVRRDEGMREAVPCEFIMCRDHAEAELGVQTTRIGGKTRTQDHLILRHLVQTSSHRCSTGTVLCRLHYRAMQVPTPAEHRQRTLSADHFPCLRPYPPL